LGGTIYLSDGTTQISVDIDDVRNTAADASLNVTAVTHSQLAAALEVKAAANTSFKVSVSATTSTLVFTEKAGEGAGVVKMIYTGSSGTGGSAAKTATFSGGVAGTTGGVMNADLSEYKSTLSTSTKDVDSSNTPTEIDAAILGVAQARADFGAVINTLEHSLDNLNIAIQNTAAARSAIMDADYAAETTELARTQIIQQAGTAMIAQANQKSQSVLQLLKG
jgi:flagellin